MILSEKEQEIVSSLPNAINLVSITEELMSEAIVKMIVTPNGLDCCLEIENPLPANPAPGFVYKPMEAILGVVVKLREIVFLLERLEGSGLLKIVSESNIATSNPFQFGGGCLSNPLSYKIPG